MKLKALVPAAAFALAAAATLPQPTRAQEDPRCADLASTVQSVAEARDAGLEKRDYKHGFHMGIDSAMSGSGLNYEQRQGQRRDLDSLIDSVWKKRGSSPEELGEKANAWCEKWGFDLSDPFGDEVRRIRKGEGLPPEP